MIANSIIVGRAFCSMDGDNPNFESGMRGAFVRLACKAEDVPAAAQMIASELAENTLTIRGFDYLFDVNYMDRGPSGMKTP